MLRETTYEPAGQQTKSNDETKVGCRKLVGALGKIYLSTPLQKTGPDLQGEKHTPDQATFIPKILVNMIINN